MRPLIMSATSQAWAGPPGAARAAGWLSGSAPATVAGNGAAIPANVMRAAQLSRVADTRAARFNQRDMTSMWA